MSGSVDLTSGAQAPTLDVEMFDGGVRVAVVGELRRFGTDELVSTLRMLSSRYDADQIDIDLTEVTFVDVWAAMAMQEVARPFRSTGRLRVRRRSRLVDALLDLTGGRELVD